MKLSINPLPALVARAEFYVNTSWAPRPQDLAHDRKRRLAEQATAGGKVSPEFAAAAELEGMTTFELAALILSKPDALMERENRRRAIIVALRAATSRAEIDQILQANNVQMPPSGHEI